MGFSFAAVDGLLFLVSPCIMLYAGTFFLKVKPKGAYWVVGLTAMLATAFCPFILASPWRVVAGAVVLGVPMLLFSRDILLRRLMVVACLLLMGLAADIASILAWYALSASDGAQVSDASYRWGEMAISHGTRIVVTVGLLALFSLAYRRMSHLHTNRGALVFGGFIVMQLLLLVISVVSLIGDDIAPRWYVQGMAVATSLSALVDVPLFLRLHRFNYRERQARRAEILQHELDHYLQQYEAVEREIRLVGRLRHDLRNQANVAMLLAQQGEPARACEHLDMLVDEIVLRSAEVEAPVAVDEPDAEAPAGGEAAAKGVVPSASAGAKAGSGPAAETGQPHRVGRSTWEKRPMGGGIMAVKGARRSLFVEVAAFPLSQLAVLVLLYARALAGPTGAAQWSVLFVVTALCAVVDVVLIRAIVDMARHRLVDERIRILEEQKDLQRQQYQRLRQELDEARRVRRDIVAALVESRAFLKRAEVPQALASMERAVGLSGGVRESYCENRVVNALIMMKLRRCAEEGIAVSCTAVVPERLHILDVDLCAAFSNLLDNAINGCLAVARDRRRIEVRACLVAGVMMVDVRNSAAESQMNGKGTEDGRLTEGRGGEAFDGPRRRRRSDRWERFRTGPSTLARHHGWGLQILEVLAIRYNGTFEYGREGDHEFRATLMLMNEEREQL